MISEKPMLSQLVCQISCPMWKVISVERLPLILVTFAMHFFISLWYFKKWYIMQKIGNGKGRVRNFARGKKTLQHLQGQHQGIISRKYYIKRYIQAFMYQNIFLDIFKYCEVVEKVSKIGGTITFKKNYRRGNVSSFFCHNHSALNTLSPTSPGWLKKNCTKKNNAIFSIYGKNGIIPWHFFQILCVAFRGHWGRMTSGG